ncbi:MAG: hypothetical protein QOH96_2186 [Blastocatellia bacterium]|jgi:Trk K+ transport system NAD-binding subunit|nr:hypothetical protein [Blastocatellia bacterium]
MPATLERFNSKVFSGLWRFPQQSFSHDTTVIVGAHEAGRLLANELSKSIGRVVLIDSDDDLCEIANALPDIEVINGDATDIEVLKRARAEQAKCVFAATTNDEVNLKICKLAEMSFDTPRLIARVSETSTLKDFELMGYEVMSMARAAVALLKKTQVVPQLVESLKGAGESELLAEINIVSPASIGRRLDSFPPHSCEVIRLERGEVSIPVYDSTALQMDDILIVFGSTRAVEALRAQLNPPC